ARPQNLFEEPDKGDLRLGHIVAVPPLRLLTTQSSRRGTTCALPVQLTDGLIAFNATIDQLEGVPGKRRTTAMADFTANGQAQGVRRRGEADAVEFDIFRELNEVFRHIAGAFSDHTADHRQPAMVVDVVEAQLRSIGGEPAHSNTVLAFVIRLPVAQALGIHAHFIGFPVRVLARQEYRSTAIRNEVQGGEESSTGIDFSLFPFQLVEGFNGY